jgi:hypothetical protein
MTTKDALSEQRARKLTAAEHERSAQILRDARDAYRTHFPAGHVFSPGDCWAYALIAVRNAYAEALAFAPPVIPATVASQCSCMEIAGEDPRCIRHGEGTMWAKEHPDICELAERLALTASPNEPAKAVEAAFREGLETGYQCGKANETPSDDAWERSDAILTGRGVLANPVELPGAEDVALREALEKLTHKHGSIIISWMGDKLGYKARDIAWTPLEAALIPRASDEVPAAATIPEGMPTEAMIEAGLAAYVETMWNATRESPRMAIAAAYRAMATVAHEQEFGK